MTIKADVTVQRPIKLVAAIGGIAIGPQGKNNYELAVLNGFEGTLEDYLVSLEGKSAYQSYLEITTDPEPLSYEQWANLIPDLQSQIELIRADVDQLKNEEDPIQEYESFLHFPNLGKGKIIYIDLESSIPYRWDEAGLKYYKINEFDIINGGN